MNLKRNILVSLIFFVSTLCVKAKEELCLEGCKVENVFTLTVEASGFKNQEGFFLVKIFKEEHSKFFPAGEKEKHYYLVSRSVVSKEKKSLVVFKDLPEGNYAIASFHDDNKSGKLEKNFFGIPKKDWAVSNNVRPSLRAPTFEESSFVLNKDRIISLEVK